jgi:hypothetical protein
MTAELWALNSTTAQRTSVIVKDFGIVHEQVSSSRHSERDEINHSER